MHHQSHLCLLAAGMVSVAMHTPGNAAPAYPLKSSANGRFLVDQNNTPTLITGDSPHALMVNLSEADAVTFLADREAYGFNTVTIYLLCGAATGGRTNCSTIDGMLPFTNTLPSKSSYDLSTPNEAYFAHVDRIVNLAAQEGLQVMLDPAETSGFLTTLLDNGTARCRAYGQYLGNRYQNFPNILWYNGNDFQNWANTNDDAVVRAVALGIQDKDTNHIHTIELDYYTSDSLDDPSWGPIISLNAAYSYYPSYAQVLEANTDSSSTPVFLAEANYEFENLSGPLTTAPILRKQEYWTLLSGAAGQLYGNHYTWQFASGWQTNLDTPGAVQISYLKALFEPRAWYNLAQDTNHLVVTAGYGTFATNGTVDANDYATAARTADGTLVMVYLPALRTLTVDMSKLSGPAVAQWYDPAGGSYVQISGSPFTNSGVRNFTPPGKNSDGDGGWVLLLETLSTPTPTVLSFTSAGPGTNGFVVSFNTLPGLKYELQAVSNSLSGAWFPLVTNILGTGGPVQITDTNTLGRIGWFYRVKTGT